MFAPFKRNIDEYNKKHLLFPQNFATIQGLIVT